MSRIVEAEADAVVDQRRAAQHAALEDAHAEVDGGLQPALLVEQGGHRVLAAVEVRAADVRALLEQHDAPAVARGVGAITAPPAPEPITHRSASITASPARGRAHGERRQRERRDGARAPHAERRLHPGVVVVAREEQDLELRERPQQRAPAGDPALDQPPSRARRTGARSGSGRSTVRGRTYSITHSSSRRLLTRLDRIAARCASTFRRPLRREHLVAAVDEHLGERSDGASLARPQEGAHRPTLPPAARGRKAGRGEPTRAGSGRRGRRTPGGGRCRPP